MFKWEKLGRIFNPYEVTQNSWMQIYAQSPCPIIFDDFVRIFFTSREKADNNGQFVSRLGYIDVRKDNLFEIINTCKEPILPLGEKGTFDEFGTYPVSLLQDEGEIKAYYAGWTRCESVPFNAAIGLAISKDSGQSFQKLGKGPIIPYTPDEPFVLGSPRIKKFGDIYYLWYSAGKKWVTSENVPQPVYKIRFATSKDGIHWEKNGQDIISNVLEADECQASAEVIYLNNTYHMFFSYRYNLGYREKDRGYKIGYAKSKDLMIWEREDSLINLEKSEFGWDSESISYPSIFELDEKIYMLYQGNEMGKNGFGLARLDKESLV